MALKIENIDEKPLLARKEVSATFTFQGKATPSNADVRKAVAGELKVDEKLVVVKSIYTSFGTTEALIKAYAYNTEDDMKKIEPKNKKEEKNAENLPICDDSAIGEHP